MSDVLVIYHANCADGFCAAWLLHYIYPDAEFVPAHYGGKVPNVTGKRVIIADFSFPKNVMIDIASKAKRVLVLDHHKTALEELDGLADGYKNMEIKFDMNKSGGRLVYEHFRHQLPPKLQEWCWLVEYTEDRDLWRNKLANSEAINAALRSYPTTFSSWDELNDRGCSDLVPEGIAIRRDQLQTVENHVRNAREIILDGHRILAVNATSLFSEIAGELAKNRPFGACYFDRADGFRQWSLRSRGEFDVSEVAKKFGGGGHKNAAGFQSVLGV